MAKKSKSYKIGTEIGNFNKGTAKRKFTDGFYNELYRGETKNRSKLIKQTLKRAGHDTHIIKKDKGYSVFYK